MKEKNVTILVNSCDKYEDAWDPFFKLLKVQWPDCPYDMVLSTETKSYKCDCFDVRTVNSPTELSWSARLKNVLNQIDTEYVLFFLEDFFLLKKVRTDIFERALSLIESNPEIGLITFNKRRWGSSFPEETDYEKCFVELKKKVKNRTNVLVSLWRKEYFLKLIYEDENPWEYEINSNIRSRYAGYKVYTQNYEASSPAFRYCVNPADGYGIMQGKWLRKNRELFEANGIYGVNYDNLGVFETDTSYEEARDESLRKKAKREADQKEYLKSQKLSVRIKENAYNLYKRIKKSFIANKIAYWKTCVRYFKYYRKKQTKERFK